MSHLFSSGCFTRGRAAWHGLGTVINGTVTPREAFGLANADWQAIGRPAYDVNMQPIPGCQQIVRGDTGAHLSMQSDSYQIVQNEQLIRIAEAISNQATIDAVTVLAGGRRVTFTAEINGTTAEPIPGDAIRQYLVGVTSHDGTVAFQAMFSPVRVVCQNTLSAALGIAERGASNQRVKIRHTRNANDLIRHIPQLIDTQRQQFLGGLPELTAMANQPCSIEQFRNYVAAVFADQLTGTINAVRGDNRTARPKALADLPQWLQLQSKFHGRAIGSDIPGFLGTFWGAYQSVTEYLTHDAGRTKDPSEAARLRLESLYWGPAAATLNKAHTLALAATRA
jgi:phage/plasmid-like protein (TIGR03299 family)